ncbi:MAG: hypothetical protein M8354_05665 [Halalkalicoccus sp.]|nr:hypothetical protein [Halalkalicoccus sp.]
MTGSAGAIDGRRAGFDIDARALRVREEVLKTVESALDGPGSAVESERRRRGTRVPSSRSDGEPQRNRSV